MEEEGNAEKHQMAAMHQQRVLAHINQRKREAMNCYTQSLTEQPPNVSEIEYYSLGLNIKIHVIFRRTVSRNACRNCCVPCTRIAPMLSPTIATCLVPVVPVDWKPPLRSVRERWNDSSTLTEPSTNRCPC